MKGRSEAEGQEKGKGRKREGEEKGKGYRKNKKQENASVLI